MTLSGRHFSTGDKLSRHVSGSAEVS